MSGLLHDLADDAARLHGDRVAVRDRGRALTHRRVRDLSLRWATRLASLGVGRGDRVVVPDSAGIRLPALAYAVSRVGAVLVVVDHRAPTAALEHIVLDADPVLAVGGAPALAGVAAAHGLPTVELDDFDLDDFELDGRFDPEDRTGPPGPGPVGVDPVLFIYTSGTTGRPKAVVSTHDQVTFAARAIHTVLDYRATDVVFGPLPLSFDYGLYQVFLVALAGACLELGGPDDTGRLLLHRLHEAGATVLPAVPSLAATLSRLLRRPGALPPPLRLLTNTGAAMPLGIVAELREQIPGLGVQLMFGLTECKRATIMHEDGDLRRPGSCGRALPGTEVFVVDDAGRRLPTGEVGEVVVRGPHVMSGYWRCPELSAQRFRRVDGLFPQLHTGDYGWVDAEGYLYFEGRRDDLYKERGTRVSATEVEAATYRVRGVEAVCVLPPTDGAHGATLVVASDRDGAEVLAELRDQLEQTKVPSRCVVLDRLPQTSNGKIDRRTLGQLVAGDLVGAGEKRG